MIKRIVCFLSAVIVATSSAFAWDAYSFTGVYDVASSAPVLYSSSPTSFELLEQSSFSYFEPSNSSFLYCGSGIFDSPLGGSFPIYDMRYLDGTLTNQLDIGPWYDASITDPSFDSDIDSITFPYLGKSFAFIFNFPSSFSSSAISLDAYLKPSIYYTEPSMSDWDSIYPTSLTVAVNTHVVGTYYPNSTTNTFSISDIFVEYNGISSISFIFEYPSIEWDLDDFSYPIYIHQHLSYLLSDAFLTVSSLSDLSAIDGYIDDSQESINQHEAVESQWTGSMSSNFDALDMDSFAFPSGLLSGFSLITGIFQDLWNGMGDYKILYVFPLFLGIALLLIGRISKFSGGQSSSRSNRGDDGA